MSAPRTTPARPAAHEAVHPGGTDDAGMHHDGQVGTGQGASCQHARLVARLT